MQGTDLLSRVCLRSPEPAVAMPKGQLRVIRNPRPQKQAPSRSLMTDMRGCSSGVRKGMGTDCRGEESLQVLVAGLQRASWKSCPGYARILDLMFNLQNQLPGLTAKLFLIHSYT